MMKEQLHLIGILIRTNNIVIAQNYSYYALMGDTMSMHTLILVVPYQGII